MPYMTKDGETILVDDGAVAYWLGQGWEPDANQDQVADSSPVGATETAYFITTGPVMPSDGSGGVVDWEADPREGDLPEWASINVDGNVELGAAAGTCAFAVTGCADFDFSETTPPNEDDLFTGGLLVKLDGVEVLNQANGDTDQSNGQDAQSGATLIGGGLLVGDLVTLEMYPTSTVTDGTATPRVALTITRIAQAPVLPEA